MKRFFSYTSGYSGLEVYPTEGEARANFETCFEAITDKMPRYLRDELNDWCWGELHGVIRSGEAVALHAPPHPEVESLRAELAALRERVGAVVAELQEMEARHRRAVRSPAYGEYSFERAEAYQYAVDMLREALEASGGEK